MKPIIVTGAAGFIGARTAGMLLERGQMVWGLDNLNDYYDVRLKKHRLKALLRHKRFRFHRVDIEDMKAVRKIFKKGKPSAAINLAARAGVRYSLVNPWIYMSTNASGMLNILEASRETGVNKVIMASTSSLYAGQQMPFKESLPVNTPISPYAASKKAAEAICYTYHHLFKMNITILRYFTVYGPAGRPDMAPFRFIKWIDEGKPLQQFGDGSQSRDFTYVDDIARGTIKALSLNGYHTINLGSNRPWKLSKFIRLIEEMLGKKAKIKVLPKNQTDMEATWADITQAKDVLKWKPEIGLEEGLTRTIDWYEQNRPWLSKVRV